MILLHEIKRQARMTCPETRRNLPTGPASAGYPLQAYTVLLSSTAVIHCCNLLAVPGGVTETDRTKISHLTRRITLMV